MNQWKITIMGFKSLGLLGGALLLASLSGCKFNAGFTTGYSVNHSIEVRPESDTTVTGFKLGFGFQSQKLVDAGAWTDEADWTEPELVFDAEEGLFAEVVCDAGSGYETYDLNSGWTWKTPFEERKYVFWVADDKVMVRASYEKPGEGREVRIERTVVGGTGVSVNPGSNSTEIQMGEHVILILNSNPKSVCS